MKKQIIYSEPAEYFPKEIRKKYKLGEFAEPDDGKKEAGKSPKADKKEKQ